jgi:hypothetical protein
MPTDDGINASQLLKALNSASNEKPLLAFDVVIPQEVFPRANTEGRFHGDCLNNVLMEAFNSN